MLRIPASVICFSLLSIATGQVLWSYSGDADLYTSLATSPVERNDGGYLANLINYTGPSTVLSNISTDFLILDPDGVSEVMATWVHPGWYIIGYDVIPNAANDSYDVFATPLDENREPLGSLHLVMNNDLEVEPWDQWTLYSPFPNARGASGSAIRTSTGDVVQVAGVFAPPATEPDNLVFQRYSGSGDPVNIRIYENGRFYPQQIVESEDGFLVLFSIAEGLGPVGVSKVLRFDHEFNYTGGFALPDVNGNPPEVGQDSIPFVKGLAAMSAGGVLVSGEYNPHPANI